MTTVPGSHADIMWVIIIGLFSLAGTIASIAAAGWSRAGKLQVEVLKQQGEILKEGQEDMKLNQRDLAKSISNVHGRIDGVCKDIADVDKSVHELRGRITPLEKIYNKVEVRP